MKKATTAAKTGTMSVPYAEFRYKLQAAFCPTATGEDRASLPCQAYALTKKMKAAVSAEDKKSAMEAKTKLLKEQESKTAEEKKAAAPVHMALYKKMFAAFCTGANAADEACTNPLVKRLCGPGGK